MLFYSPTFREEPIFLLYRQQKAKPARETFCLSRTENCKKSLTFIDNIGIISKHVKTHPGVAQLGSALDWGSRGRGFKSRHSDHIEEKPSKLKGLGGFSLLYRHA